MIACALALSATVPSFSQTTTESALALTQRTGGSATAADDSARVDVPIGRQNKPSRSGAAPAEDLETHARAARRIVHDSDRRAHARRTSRTFETALTRNFESLRARLGVLIDAPVSGTGVWGARVAAALVDAARLGIAPQTVDRGQLLRASLAGNLRASYLLLKHPELLLGAEAAVAYRSATFTPGEQQRALRLALYRRLVAQAGDAEDLVEFDVLGHANDDLVTGWLDAASAMRALVAIELGFGAEPLAREARLARAFLLAGQGRGVAYLEAMAARLFASLLSDPRADIASAAADALWRLQNLRVGCHAPQLCGIDAVGNELCLQDFRGRVVLVRFWSMDDATSEDVLHQDAFLVQHFWDHPVSVLGVNRDADRELYLQRYEELGLPGNQIYEGPLGEDLMPEIRERRAGRPLIFDAWREAHSGSSYLIDSRGVIRAVDPPLGRLPELIQSLVDESYREKRMLGF